MFICIQRESKVLGYTSRMSSPNQNKKNDHINTCLQTFSFRGYSWKKVPLAVRAMFKQEGASANFSWSVRDRLLPFTETQIPHLRSLFWNCEQHPKVVTDQLRALPHEDFQHSYREWQQRLRRCVASQRNCFEGDNVDLQFSS